MDMRKWLRVIKWDTKRCILKKIHENWKTNLIFLLFMIFSLLYKELILRSLIGYGGKYLFLFTGVFPLFLMGIFLISRGKWRYIVADIYFLGLSLLFISQALYFQFFTNLYSFYLLTGAGQIARNGDEIIRLIVNNAKWVFLLALPVILYFFFFRKSLSQLGDKKTEGIKLCGLASLFFLVLHYSMGAFPPQEKRISDLYFYTNPLVETTREFGLVSSLGIDLRQRIFGEPIPKELIKEEKYEDKYIEEGKAEEIFYHENIPLEKELVQEEIVIEPQILDIDFKALEKQRESETLALLDGYFAFLEPSYSNEYTGIFEGYNLIFITAESFWWPAVDQELTPTLYQMIHQGIHLENFYNPIWTVSTYDGEYVGLTGLLPKDGVWSLYRAAFNFSPQSLGWRMDAANYNCYAYHNHTYTYYDRHESHPNLGYDYKGLGSGVDVQVQWPGSDLEMMEITMDEFLDKEPFHVYYLTVSGHGAYSFSGNAMANKNKAFVEELDLSEEAASYIAANMELEHALSYLLARLEEEGLAERTLIVLNPDHIPYSLSEEAMEELAGSFSREIDRYRSHGIIYTPNMEGIEIKKPVSSLDLLPTVYNLLGLSYDSRLIIGRDVFSEQGLVIFYNRSWLSEKGYYNSRSEKFESMVEEEIPEGYVDKINQEVKEKFYFSGLLLEEDYFSYLPEKAFSFQKKE